MLDGSTMVLLLVRNLRWHRSYRRLVNGYVGFSRVASDDHLAPFSPYEEVVTSVSHGADDRVLVVVTGGGCYG